MKRSRAGNFLAQFAGMSALIRIRGMAKWAAGQTRGSRSQAGDLRLFDLERAAESQTLCDEVKRRCLGCGLAGHGAFDALQGTRWRASASTRCSTALRAGAGRNSKRGAWGVEQVVVAASKQEIGLSARYVFRSRWRRPFYLSVAAAAFRLIDEAFKELGGAGSDSECVPMRSDVCFGCIPARFARRHDLRALLG